MDTPIRYELANLLTGLERELRRAGAWESVMPSAERMASEVPFAHDTLEFTQWVQWICIPRFRALLEGGHPLPAACAIAPVAEDALARLDADTDEVLALLRAIDRLLTERAVSRP